MPSGAQPKRRPTTYGKASRKIAFGFTGSGNEAEGSDNGSTCTQETLLGRVRKTPPMTSEPATKKVMSVRSTGSQEEGPKATVSLQPSPIRSPLPSGYDLFDVPSSDEDRPAARSKPVLKKRKLQSKATGSESMGDGHIRETASSGPGKGLLPAPEIQKHTGSLDMLSPKVRAGKQSEKSVTAAKRSPKSVPGSTKSSGSRSPTTHTTVGKLAKSSVTAETSVKVPKQTTDRTSGSPSLPRNASSAPGTPKTSTTSTAPKHPRTPPRSTTRLAPATNPVSKFFSPSGLDIPGLSISNGLQPPTNSSQTDRTPRMVPKAGNTLKTKVKDRLTTRDGSNRQVDLSPEDESSSDEEVSEGEAVSSSQHQAGEGPTLHLTESPAFADSSQTLARQKHGLAANGPRLTYAARERSLRKDDGEDEDALLELAFDGDAPAQKQSRRLDFRNNTQSSQTFEVSDASDEEAIQSVPVRTIHELRQAGGNARISSQIETILDDIDSSTISLRRSGLLELQEKLQDPNFRSYFIDNGLTSRLILHMNRSMDLLTKSLVAATLLGLIAHETSSRTSSKIAEPMKLAFLRELMNTTSALESISKNRSSNASKAIQQEIRKMCEALLVSPLWRLDKPSRITPRSLALQCLEYVVRNLRETGLSRGLLDKSLVDSLLKVLSEVTQSTESASSIENAADIRLLLSTLESSTLFAQASQSAIEDIWTSQAMETVSELVIFTKSWMPQDKGSIWSLTLRLCLNLTSGSASACRILANAAVLDAMLDLLVCNFDSIDSKSTSDDQTVLVDNLVLALGFLITLAERGKEHRKIFSASVNDARSPLDTLLDLFTAKWQKAFEVVPDEDESRKNVPMGFLAALLSYLSLDPGPRAHIASRLEGGNLRHLLIAVGEFLKIYRKAEEVRSMEEGVDLTVSFVVKLQSVVDTLVADEA